MLESRKILNATIGYIIGIIMGLYCKYSIALLYLTIYLIYKLFSKKQKIRKFKLISVRRYSRYIKIIFNQKVIIIIIFFSIISNSIVLIQNNKYEEIYEKFDEKSIETEAIVLEKVNSKYKIKISNIKMYLKTKVELEYGDKINIQGKYLKPEGQRNYKGFNYQKYLKTHGIYGTIISENMEVKQKNKGNIIIQKIISIKKCIDKRIESLSISNEHKSIVKSIILGDKSKIDDKTKDEFSESNISYILAVSGMHISYIIGISNIVFNHIIGKHYSKIATSIIVLVYIGITGFTPSAVRAGITGILLIMSNFVYRKNDIWESLSISMFIILIYNPFSILDIGLQLSFFGTIGIILLSNTLKEIYQRNTENTLKKAIRKSNKNKVKLIKALKSKRVQKIIEAIIITISANIAVAPLVLIYFNNINILNLIISVTVSFIIGLIITISFICIFFNLKFFSKILSILIGILLEISKIGSKIYLNQIYFIRPNIFSICIYYLIIINLNFFAKIKLERNKSEFQKRIINLRNLVKYKIRLNKEKIISLFLIFSILTNLVQISTRNLKIYFVDVGQGDCTVVVTPQNKSILIDGGGSENQNIR